MIALLGLLACNTAPTDYRGGAAPGALSPWFEPSEEFCDQNDLERILIDGYHWCGMLRSNEVIAVDDPIYTPCAAVSEANGTALTVFDGVLARAYPLDLMVGRELVNDDWRGEPLLVDY